MCKHSCKCFLSLLCSGRVRNKTEKKRLEISASVESWFLAPVCWGCWWKKSICWRTPRVGEGEGSKGMQASGEAGSPHMDGYSWQQFLVQGISKGNYVPHLSGSLGLSWASKTFRIKVWWLGIWELHVLIKMVCCLSIRWKVLFWVSRHKPRVC